MFEVGKHYDLTIGNQEIFSMSRIKVLGWEAPLLKYEVEGQRYTILNTSSPMFFMAELGPTPEEIEEASRAFEASTPL